MAVNRNVVKPVASSYRENVAASVQERLHNFLKKSPRADIRGNYLMQGNLQRSWNFVQRFGINSTVGLTGIFDIAGTLDRRSLVSVFGQTMGVWGVASGTSVQLPLPESSNVRDTVGRVVDMVMNPLTLATGGFTGAADLAVTGATVVDGRASVLPMTHTLEAVSIDYYAASRDIISQRRSALIATAKAPE